MASSSTISNFSIRTTDITDLHSDIIATHIFTRIDCQSLVYTALASPQLRSFSNNEKLWTEICNSTWTSTKHPQVQKAVSAFPGGHHSFFSDSFPVIHFQNNKKWWHLNRHINTPLHTAEQLISALDINYKNNILCSKVDVINTNTQNFQTSIFKVEALDEKESLSFPIECEDEETYFSDLKENMTLSWIVIDVTQNRAANISSKWPVSVRHHWVDGDIEVKYAIIMPWTSRMSEMVEIRIVVMLQWEEGRKYLKLRKVKLQVLDMNKMCLGGKESLRILQEAIQYGTRKKGKRGDETEIYRNFVELKRMRREEKGSRGKRSKIFPLLVSIIFLILTKIVIPKFYVLL